MTEIFPLFYFIKRNILFIPWSKNRACITKGKEWVIKLSNEYALHLFREGSNFQSYELFGAHIVKEEGAWGVRFRVWAPHAKQVRVVGTFNDWYGDQHRMEKIEEDGVWSLFISNLKEGELYKYEIHTQEGEILLKSDPYGFQSECRPKSASVITELNHYQWNDHEWVRNQKNNSGKETFQEPMLIYEVHLGSWKTKENGELLSYRELADELVEYAVKMGYTHLEILPLMEHPFDGSWGYQVTGYYAVTSRYGNPDDFMYFIDQCHQNGLGVILDWVPSHFCKDNHGLRQFDGSPLYESDDFNKSENLQWGTLNFDLSKMEVVSFLLSNAVFWLDVYHIDGIRVDAVASMLYLDYNKEPNQWSPNLYGGNENLEAITFFRKLNKLIHLYFPNKIMIAEESTSWPMVTGSTYKGGLGFHYKWNMGWMNDILRYMETDPIYRKWHHELLTFSFMYTFSENFILPLSHDEVVHGKKSLLEKMPGDYWQKFANLRSFYAYMMAHPGKKLIFMGGEFGQFIEWKFTEGLDWHLLDYEMHKKLQDYVKDLNHIYREEKAFWQNDHNWNGFQWIDPHDYSQSIITFMRKGMEENDRMIIICNFTPVVREVYRIGVPSLGTYQEIFNSDWEQYGGLGQRNREFLDAEQIPWHNQPFSIEIRVPPLATIYLKLKEFNTLDNSMKEEAVLCKKKNVLQ